MPGLSESTYPQRAVLVDGYYPATLKEVNEYTKTYEGKETDRLAWIFDVEAPEDAVDPDVEIDDEEYSYTGKFEVAAHTGVNKSKKANSNWQKLDMDKIVPEGCTNTDELIGTKCTVNVSSFEGSDGITKNVIEKIRPARKGRKNQAPAEDAASEDEKDFEDIPF